MSHSYWHGGLESPPTQSHFNSRFLDIDLLAAICAPHADWPQDVSAALTLLAPGHAFTVPEVTFRKITDDRRLDWEGRFAGLRT
jgi:hypothetical protein